MKQSVKRSFKYAADKYAGLSPKQKALLIGGGVLTLGTGVYFLLRHFSTKKKNKFENASFEIGSAETIAKQIKMAFDNNGFWGTQLEELRRIYSAIPSKEFYRKIQDAYAIKYGNLNADLTSELKSTEYNELLYIMAAKPNKEGDPAAQSKHTFWANRLRAAFDKEVFGYFPATDEEAVKAVFIEIPTKADFDMTDSVFQSLYGKTIMEELAEEINYFERYPLIEIIESKP